ncbi:RNA degradosome polyphosphate kinase [Rubrivirga marina]|uniref:Polyphosphate kinase n=1 Tax=Rubrivirga marina TaxID=1196024 RepID=A0A271J606_9BACT|nr:RNA degradosome polyphosphate kinase [Rubrivirga marina]
MEPVEVPDGAPLDHPALYFNRELSWIDFNWRVFFQALDERVPLLERVRFVAITANNLDEFYRKRIGGLKRQLGAGVRALSPDGRTPREQLELTTAAVLDMQAELSRVWEDELRPELAAAGVVVREYDSLEDDEQAELDRVFRGTIFPILTPLAVDSGHPFPFISNLSLSLAVTLRHPTRGTEHFARLKVPTGRARFMPVDGSEGEFVAIEDLIANNAEELFRGMDVEGVYAFRVTRNASVDRSEEEADDLLSMISEELRERKFSEVVRLEVEAEMPDRVRELLRRELNLTEPEDVVEVDGLLDLAGLEALYKVDRSDLKDLPWEPVVPIRLRHMVMEDDDDMFSVIRKGDLLVHHPYESFAASTQRFIEEAAEDPRVLAIKLTLYRTSQDSPIVRSLIRAAEAGKQVAALVELKARFDEENNIEWAQRLERTGAHVAYGLVGLKTHAKTTLIVREEPGGLRTYCHLGTGNYNPTTARFYTDFGLFTCREDIGEDLVGLFHFLTGYAPEQEYQTLAVAPRDLRSRFVSLIRREVAHAKAGRKARIIAKMNALDDVGIIQELYCASRAGVQIDLIVRGHTRMRPGVEGYSENVRIVSIVGRFLEHSRIYYFHNGGDDETYIGSADWMRRNLDDRVEVVAPVEDETARARLKRTLKFCLEDNRQAWDLGADGRYSLRWPGENEKVRAFHDTLMRRARRRTEEDDAAWSF